MRVKKIMFLSLILLSFSIGGCGSYQRASNNKDVAPEGLSDLTVNGDSDLIIGDVRSGKYDNGHKFKFKLKSVTDVTFYAYLDDEKLKPVDYDSNGLAIFEFTILGSSVLTISSDLFFADKEYRLKEIFPNYELLNGATVYKVTIETGTYNASEDSVNVIDSFDKDDINYNLNLYFNEPFRKYDDFIAPNDGGYTILKFLMEKDTLEINFSYGFPCYRDFSSYQYFKYANKTPNEPKILHPAAIIE
ncbi:MAG: hypothetical protein J6T15_04025 [Bacilli bacterium]|nr:hypothetical protein [Bacilli bacterium]